MQLTRYTDLALRVAMRLAVADANQEQRTLTTRTVADELSVAYAHAAKAVSQLGKLGIVETRRGRSGGLSISEHGRNASVGRLVRELEGPGEVVECEGTTPCPLNQGCRLRGALAQAQEAFFATLDPLTIADITAPPTSAILLSLPQRMPS